MKPIPSVLGEQNSRQYSLHTPTVLHFKPQDPSQSVSQDPLVLAFQLVVFFQVRALPNVAPRLVALGGCLLVIPSTLCADNAPGVSLSEE
ncbi:hypothetical protein L596_028593 [Steinernema carpocapsae]|uniref:Uncharacterized protein n=1 Tax=Steinernema carpocapsae TaxID=34508 RepID=A0A4U5LYX3_STECR|nr:hypothetical protein L596_028593 [Steinernema carpocapsae]